MWKVMLTAALAEISACGINGMVNTVLLAVVDADESGGFGEDCRWWVG
jgi:hypothetical protein